MTKKCKHFSSPEKIFNPSVPKEWGGCVNGEAIAGGDMFGCKKYGTIRICYLRLYLRCTYCLRSLKVKEKCFKLLLRFIYFLFTFYLLFALLLLFTYVLLNFYLDLLTLIYFCVLFLFTFFLRVTYCLLTFFTFYLLFILPAFDLLFVSLFI